MKPEQWDRVFINMKIAESDYETFEIEPEDLYPMIDQHFKTPYKDCDFNILHFISGDIMKNRLYETCY